MSNKNKYKKLTSINCRMVGPGGTTVDLYLTQEGIKAIWHNENCPYDICDLDDETYEAEDGHNVSIIPWDNADELIKQISNYKNKRIKIT